MNILTKLQSLYKEQLYKNSLYLMINTLVISLFGFVFWIIASHFFDSNEIGTATTLLVSANLVSNFALLGFNNSLIKYIPTSENKNSEINTALTITTITATIASILYIIFIGIVSPAFVFIQSNPIWIIIFTLSVLILNTNLLVEVVLIAFRGTEYILIKNLIGSIVKLVLPFLLLSFGALGIYSAIILPTIITIIFGFYYLFSKYSFKLKFEVNRSFIKKAYKFSLGNYIAGFWATGSTLLLPIIIASSLGPSAAAYMYMPAMIITLIQIIPKSFTQSLFVEGSYSTGIDLGHILKPLKACYMLLIPSIIGIFILGRFVLLLFGKNYSDEGIYYLYICSVGTLFSTINYFGDTILNIMHKIRLYISMNIFNAILTVGFPVLFIGHGLPGVAMGWVTAQIITAIIYLILYFKYKS
jgi:O-antigen/teichoic acid export membrane protein